MLACGKSVRCTNPCSSFKSKSNFSSISSRQDRSAGRVRAGSRSGASTLIKICGLTSSEDAEIAIDSGADMLGMIMWSKAKRAVSEQNAEAISTLARTNGAKSVGVFVDEDAHSIHEKCKRLGIQVAQLHGEIPRSGAKYLMECEGLEVIYVQHVDEQGHMVTASPESEVDWILLDGLKGGSGTALNWSELKTPTGGSQGWLLAGGLSPENVVSAVNLVRPVAVDVSSGVCDESGLKKDPRKIVAFVEAVKQATKS